MNRGGFTLLELVLALFILAVMAAALAPSVGGLIERSRLSAEARTLGELADTITASFEATDLNQLNIAALPGHIGIGDTATEFSTATAGAYTSTHNHSWFTKVARLRGLNPQVGAAPSASVQPALSQLIYNALGNPRLLFAGPEEPGKQRFLLVSLMARSDQLALPAYESGSAWFDALWNNDWEGRTAAPPAYWKARLTAPQWAAWKQGSGGMTQVYHLCVRRIVLPKYTLTINNNHPTNAAFVSYDNIANAFTAPAGSGASTTPEILGGRLATVNQGTAWPGVEALRLHLHSNDTVIVQ